MIELLEQTALAVAGTSFGIAGFSFLVGLGLNKIESRSNKTDLTSFQDLPRGTY